MLLHESRDTFYIFSSDVQNLKFGIIHSVSKYLLNTHFVPGKQTKNPALMEIIFWWERQIMVDNDLNYKVCY